MDRRIVKALIATPRLSLLVARQSEDGSLGGLILDRVEASGATLFLTAIDADDVRTLTSFFASLHGTALANRLRILDPANMLWAGGRTPLPVRLRATVAETSTLVAHLNDMLASWKHDGSVEADGDGGYMVLRSSEVPSGELLKALWNEGNGRTWGPSLLWFDPDLPPEIFRRDDGMHLTVLAPDSPSTTWFDAVTVEEKFQQSEIVLLESRDLDDGLSRALRQRFGIDDRKIESQTPEGVVIGDDLVAARTKLEEILLAPVIVASSEIHFIRRWNEPNQRYIRSSYWAATRKARSNWNTAESLLRSLDRSSFARAAALPDLASKTGGEQLLDNFSGAVCFSPGFYEFELPKLTGNRPADALVESLLRYFAEKLYDMPFDRPLLRRRMFSNSLVLLRGEGYYSNLKQTPPWEKAEDYQNEAKAIERLLRELQGRGKELDAAFLTCFEGGESTSAAWKLLLAMFDQIRNLGLIMMSVELHRWRESQRSEQDRPIIRQAADMVATYYQVMLGDVRAGGQEVVERMLGHVVRIRSELETFQNSEREKATKSEWYEPGRPIRGWREADDPYENLLVGLLAAASCGERAFSALGIFWGGIELPMSVAAAATAMGRKPETFGFLVRQRYSGEKIQEEEYFCDLSAAQFKNLSTLHGSTSHLLLLDDNSLSGKTLDSARDLLLEAGVRDVSTWIVRFSGERREGQIKMADSGVVHPAYLTERMNGYLGETPYARSYSRKDYESPSGVFNTARSRILRYLHNNGFASVFEREGF